MPIDDLRHERRQLAEYLAEPASENDGWRHSAKQVSYNLLGLMIKRDTPYTGLVQASGIHPATLTKILHGNHSFGTNVLVRLAHALDTDAYSLFWQPRIRSK